MIRFRPDQRILVTGASSGIGRAIALTCNALGATVVASGRNEVRLAAARAESAAPDRFITEPWDLAADPGGLPAWVTSLRTRHGRFHGLAHAAGTVLTAPFMAYDIRQARELFDILCHVPILLARAVLDRRNCGEGACAVLVSSVAAVSPCKGQTAYGAAKAALACAVRSMALELASRRVRVNCISPGLVRTPMFEELVATLGEGFLAMEEQRHPLGLGEPGDVAGLAAFLLSPAARWITGRNCVVDGGRSL
jgi:NAD(P)-dependent dehydrogenase (short-subunit alcohol dehydrogenase family)